MLTLSFVVHDHIGALGQDRRQLGPQEIQTLSDRDPAFQQEGTDLIDDAGALADQSRAHTMQRLQIELLGGLGRHELHRRALHRFSDRLGIAIVVLFTFAIRAHVFRRHQSGIVAKRLQFAAQVMRPGARLHADEARLQVGEASFHLAARPFLPQHDAAASILADEVERVLTDIDADHGDFAIELLGHGVLLCPRGPLPALLAGEAGARPDHPILGHKPAAEATEVPR
jgi:hypothetical protein